MTPFSLPTRITFGDQSALRRILTDKISHAPCVLFLRDDDADRLALRNIIEAKKSSGLIWIKPEGSTLTLASIRSVAESLKSSPISQVIAVGDKHVTRLSKAVMATFKRKDNPVMSAILIGPDTEILSPVIRWIDPETGPADLNVTALRFSDLLICEPAMVFDDRRALLVESMEALSLASQAHWSPSASLIVQRLALKAIELIVRNLPKVLADPQAKQSRSRLVDGFLLTSMAYSNVKPSVISDISRRLSIKSGISPAFFEVLILPDLLRHHLSSLRNPEGLYEAYDIDNPQALGDWISTLCAEVFPLTLSSCGLKVKDLDDAISTAYANLLLDENTTDYPPELLKAFLMNHWK